MKFKFAILAGLLAASLSGCGSTGMFGDSEYGCSGMPVGVRCMSSRDAYNATEEKDYISPTDHEVTSESDRSNERLAAAVNAQTAGLMPIPDVPKDRVAIRTPSRVMRVVVAPWEDNRGNLHMADIIYTEIAPRRWQIGLPAEVEDQMMSPLETGDVEMVQPKQKKAASATAPASAAVAKEKGKDTAVPGRPPKN